jgi:hypothetical protein
MDYGQTQLYRIYDGETLLYVGISRDYDRLRKHEHGRRYGKDVAGRARVEEFPDRFAAEIAETMAQYYERPRDGNIPKEFGDMVYRINLISDRYISAPDRDTTSDLDRSASAQSALAGYLFGGAS